MLKEFLSQKGIDYEEHDVTRDTNSAQEMVNRTGQRGVPVTIIDGQIIVGFDRPRLEQLLAQKLPSFGAAIADAGKITAAKGMQVFSGAYVGRVRPGSNAEKTGLFPGDIIIEINNQRVSNASNMESIISRMTSGEKLFVVLVRNNQTITVSGIA